MFTSAHAAVNRMAVEGEARAAKVVGEQLRAYVAGGCSPTLTS